MGRFWAWECLQLIVLALGDIQEVIRSFGMFWITLYVRKRSTTFLPKFEFCSSALTTAILVLLPLLRCVYVIECIRSTKTYWILLNYGNWMWFVCYMISFQNHPNHAIFSSICLDSIWSWYASLIRFDSNKNQIKKINLLDRKSVV